MEKSIKIIGKKQKNVFISSLLFGCRKSPISDFLSLIDFIIENKSLLKELSVQYANNEKEEYINYRRLLIRLLRNAGAYNIEKYMFRPESPSELECKIFYNILKDRSDLTREIVNELPSPAKGVIQGCLVEAGGYIPFLGNSIRDKESETIREETIKIKEKLSGFITKDENLGKYNNFNKLNNFKWTVDIPIEKTPQDILNKLKILYKDFSRNKEGNIFKLFQEYIYNDTPLCNCLEKGLNFLSGKNNNSNKVLIIISDGQSTDGNPTEIYNKYKNKSNNLFIVGGYISSTYVQNEKTLFDNLSTSDRGAKQLFDLSSEVDTDSVAFDYLRYKGWDIPLSGKCKLFIQMNNSDNMNDFLEFLNKFLDGTEDVLGDVLGKIELKELTGKNISKFEVTKQTIGNCYLHATRNIIRMARARIYPTNIPAPDDLEKEIVKEFPYRYDIKGEVLGRDTFEVLKKMTPKYRLQVKQIIGNNNYEMERKVKIILLRRRPVVLSFRFSYKQWDNFYKFIDPNSQNKRNIMTKEIINKDVPNDDKDSGGHAVVITKYDKDCFTVLNSWGEQWGDNGFFIIKDFSIFLSYRCFDVFFTLKDLTQYEIDEYNKFVERKKKEFLEED